MKIELVTVILITVPLVGATATGFTIFETKDNIREHVIKRFDRIESKLDKITDAISKLSRRRRRDR